MKKTANQSELLNSIIDFSPSPDINYSNIICCSPSDIGVIRNGGRNGARYAPRAILNRLLKFNNHLNNNKRILVKEVTNFELEESNFDQARKLATKNLSNIEMSESLIHLGGGHDQIFPLLMSLDNNPEIESILILNIDAHCDTRISDSPNSGTPFRDFDLASKKPFHLIQYGIQDFSNSKSTLSSLSRGSEDKQYIEDIKKRTENFTKVDEKLFTSIPFKVTDKTAVVFSLDCDGIDGSNMQAVSAVNPEGIPSDFIMELTEQFHKELNTPMKFFGIYEFNPVFENQSLYATKIIAALIYRILNFG